MTTADNQRPAHTTTTKDAHTLTHRQHHEHPRPDAPEATTTQHTLPTTQPLTTYIRRVVDTAPRPTPEQLTRLAGLLRNTNDDPDVPS